MIGLCANPAECAWLERWFADAGEGDGVETALARVRERCRRPELRRHWRRWFAPLAALEGVWLDGVVTVANAHTPLGAALLELQRLVVRRRPAGQAGRTPEVSPELAVDRRWLKGLAALGERFLPEVLGLTRAHLALHGGAFALEWGALGTQGHPVVVPTSRAGEALARVLACLPAEAGPRLQRGERLYRWRTWVWCREWLTQSGPEARVVALLRRKARYGQGYHGRIRLAGRRLDDWLRELAAGRGLPEAVAETLVSRLLEAGEFGGPMFGVFSAEEQALLRAWLEGGGGEIGGDRRPDKGSGPTSAIPGEGVAPDPLRLSGLPSPPWLYHHLLNLQRRDAALPAARRYVGHILARARRRVPFPWSAQRFRAWLDRLHCQALQGDEGPWNWLSPAACRWGIEQLAPAILVDGCWLQHSLYLRRELPEVGEALWRIYRDELGDGVLGRHHGNVYRRLLDQAGLTLPPFTSEDFVRHPGFLPTVFDLPAFLLAIDAQARDFLPEILGLNLAIEFSGLGRVYQRLAATLERCGFDATIVRLHQSIDNLACGHAALARDAVIAYLERFAPGGEAAVEAQWRRIWCGWQSLGVASRRFARQLLVTWLIRFAIPERSAKVWDWVRRGERP